MVNEIPSLGKAIHAANQYLQQFLEFCIPNNENNFIISFLCIRKFRHINCTWTRSAVNHFSLLHSLLCPYDLPEVNYIHDANHICCWNDFLFPLNELPCILISCSLVLIVLTGHSCNTFITYIKYRGLRI